jgi:hypothetical protein
MQYFINYGGLIMSDRTMPVDTVRRLINKHISMTKNEYIGRKDDQGKARALETLYILVDLKSDLADALLTGEPQP